ncbi:MAG: radical SAM protein [Verrucomicrobia bacterium]|nr:radical SAM protein [Verrucomicrobiota bacterium]
MKRKQNIDPDPRVTIRVIHDCNFHCPRCSTFSVPGHPARMRLPQFRRAINILVREKFHGALTISGGEPTLHPRLPDMIRYASTQLPQSTLIVFTNGSWVGAKNWKRALRGLLGGPNVVIHYSFDRQHVEGASRAAGADMKTALFDRARQFVRATPPSRFRMAFKGALPEAKQFLHPLGHVPIYLIHFEKQPARRRKKPGVLAVEVSRDNRMEVFPTLGHIPRGESLGGLETLAEALQWNRKALRDAR